MKSSKTISKSKYRQIHYNKTVRHTETTFTQNEQNMNNILSCTPFHSKLLYFGAIHIFWDNSHVTNILFEITEKAG